ncbi:unnamed protein product [Trichobilharzia regenti]|nr:unnamed protein product [Trichobilharzia regenti]
MFQPLSCSSSGDSDIGESNTNSVIEVDEGDGDDDLPLSAFLPLKSCTKPAVVDDPRWDGEYCSPECLIRVCHEAFQSWLENQHS